MNLKRYITCALLLAMFCISNAQIKTMFYGSDKVKAGGETAALYSVEIHSGFTLVTVELIPTRYRLWMSFGSSRETIIKIGEEEFPIYGFCTTVNGEEKYDRDPFSGNEGWRGAKKGEKYYYTMAFSGTVPPGLTTFSLIDKGTYNGRRGYCFRGYTINNPWKCGTNWTEESIMQNIDQNNDGICGIYEETTKKNTGQYKLACIKENGSYRLIYMKSVKKMYWWRMGDVKAELRPSATAGIFKADWYMQNKTLNEDAYIVFDGNTMKSVINDEENLYLKMYPSVVGINAPNTKVSEEWSGTGFALNNGYIVTNYHVVENAKSIKVEGIGDSPDTKYDATVVSTDQHNDLAIIKINDHRFKGFGRLPYKVKTQLSEVGEDVFVLGYPMTTSMGNEIKLTTGVVSARSGFQGNVSLYQITAPIQPGNSGGPLFDSNGNLVGIVNAKHVGAENVGYAIKASYLYGLAESASIESSLPQNNSVSGLSLSEKVKKLKRYVYMISCSSK